MLKILSALMIVGLVLSCGKKEKARTQEETPQLPSMGEREEFLEKQTIVCESGSSCPENVAKIVVYDRGNYRYCTGTLVSRNRVLTSSNCLPSYLRSTEAGCENDVHFFFNRGSRKPLRVGCKAILQASALDGNAVEYWRNDVAVLELKENLYGRESRDVTRRGMSDMDRVRIYGVEQLDSTTGIIRKEECEVVHGSYLYPLSANESSPNVLLAGCARKRGYRGAAILDSFPRIRGVVSERSGFRSSLENSPYLLKPLKDFVHGMNFACAPYLSQTGTLNEVECSKFLDYSAVVSERDRLLSDSARFGGILPRLERAADGASKYFKITLQLVQTDDRFSLSFIPQCFKNVSSWINAVKKDGDVVETPKFPSRTLRKGIDAYGRAATQELEESDVIHRLTFSGKRLFNDGLSDVFQRDGEGSLPPQRGMKACAP